MREDSIIKREGFTALAEKLDPVELERFIVLLNREKFDYTKWRKDLFEEMTIEQISEEAEKYSTGLDKKQYHAEPGNINRPLEDPDENCNTGEVRVVLYQEVSLIKDLENYGLKKVTWQPGQILLHNIEF